MSKRWIISDTHYGHNKPYTTFMNKETGTVMRPWAKDADEGDEIMIALWNDRIKPKDIVYHLGDVAIARHGLHVLPKLNGRKILIKGNHDNFKLHEYTAQFENIHGSLKLNRTILSHIPLHHASIPIWSLGNVHGHTHCNLVKHLDGSIDKRYINVCVEQSAGAPLEWDQVYAEIEERTLTSDSE